MRKHLFAIAILATIATSAHAALRKDGGLWGLLDWLLSFAA